MYCFCLAVMVVLVVRSSIRQPAEKQTHHSLLIANRRQHQATTSSLTKFNPAALNTK
jgi:hypothetical protein